MRIISAEGKVYRFETSFHRTDDDTPIEFHDEHEAFLFLVRLVDDEFSRLALRKFVIEDLSFPDLHKIEDQALWKSLAADIVVRRVCIREGGQTIEKTSFGGKKPASGSQPSAQDEDDEVTNVVAPPFTEKTWIKFEIVDDDTGEPVKGVTLKVKLPDGQSRNAKSNAAGIIEFKDIPPGTCAIEKMIDSDTLEVVTVE